MVQNILEISELRIIVIHCLRGDYNALLSAVLVNKTWAAEAMGILWEQVTARDLVPIPPCRRQQYARHIKRLLFEFDEPISVHVMLKGLEFPRLMSLLFRDAVYQTSYPAKGAEELSVVQYLQPNLRDFVYQVESPPENVLHLLETRCPQLQKVHLWCDYEPDRMISFLHHCTSLKSVRLSGNLEQPIDNGLLSCLACYNGLEFLQLMQILSPDNVDKMFKVTTAPFRDLQYLDIFIGSWTVPKLMDNMKRSMSGIRSLYLRMEEPLISPLPHVSLLSNLQKLTISCTTERAEWDKESFVTLKNLTNLRVLQIYSSYRYTHYCPDLTDNDFITIFKDMNKLVHLAFLVRCPLITTDSITSLGENCPRLAFCDVPGPFDLAVWENVATYPLFPELRELRLGQAVDRGEGAV